MVGLMIIIFILLPESPWWLVSKGKIEKATKTLLKYNGHVEGYNVDEVIVRIRRSCLPLLRITAKARRLNMHFTGRYERHGRGGALPCET